MNYSSLEELQVALDLCTSSDKAKILSDVGNRYYSWFIVTNDGHCYIFNDDGSFSDISKLTRLKHSYFKKDIKKIIIPNNVISIEDYAFYCCHKLTTIMIPSNVISIGKHTFEGCNSLTYVAFKDKTVEKVKSMDNYPFGIKDESVIKCIE